MSNVSAEKHPLHRKLPEGSIRLLKIEGTCYTPESFGKGKNLAIRCHLEELSLSQLKLNREQFTAVSYVWGSLQPERYVSLNGHFKAITPNLYDLLWQLVFAEYTIPPSLWIDAICINQEDEDEKAKQVGLMGEIYSQADIVLAWLGNAIAGQEESLADYWSELAGFYQPESSTDFWVAMQMVSSFLEECEWFYRVWTFQEIVLAKTPVLLCGSSLIPWSKLIQALEFESVDNPLRFLLEIERARSSFMDGRTSTRFDWAYLLGLTAGREATNPRDHLFALIGLYRGPRKIIADYTKSDFEVRIQTMLQLMHEGKSLFPYRDWGVSFRTTAQPENPNALVRSLIPRSWVPEWTDMWKRESGVTTSFLELHPDFSLRPQISGDLLTVRGAVLGLVSADTRDGLVTPAAKQRPFPICIHGILRGRTAGGDYLDGGETFGMGSRQPSWYEPHHICKLMYLHCTSQCSCCSSGEKFPLPQGDHEPELDSILRIIEIGWVCQLFGRDDPVTLWPIYNHEDQSIKFTIIGDAYEEARTTWNDAYMGIKSIGDVPKSLMFAPIRFTLIGDVSGIELLPMFETYRRCFIET